MLHEQKSEFEAKNTEEIASMNSREAQIIANKKVAFQNKANDRRASSVAQTEHARKRRTEMSGEHKKRQNECHDDGDYAECDDSDSASESETDERAAEEANASESDSDSSSTCSERKTDVCLQELTSSALGEPANEYAYTGEDIDDDGTASVASSHLDIFDLN